MGEKGGGGRRGDGWGRQIRTEAERRGEVRERAERVEETRGRKGGKNVKSQGERMKAEKASGSL